ncbi:MAG TPA: tetratricopeptide repeat protein [Tepidisphaeraceae bacterium]|jgi:tetratricopeptide (TPR) repeat protein
MAEETEIIEITDAERKKAQVFFDRGRTVAQAGQFDYAIDMYLEGLKFDPESVLAHSALREISLKRKASGGKDLGMLQKMKLRYGKDDRENMIIAERFLAYDPGNTTRMLELLNYAAAIGAPEASLWIGPILLRANVEGGKPEIGKFIALKDAYMRLGKWKLATEAAQRALELRPNDMDLQQTVKNLGARQTMFEGGYEGGGSFRNSIKDMEGQTKLMREDTDVRTVDAMTQQILQAREELKKEPNEPGKINKLVEALVKTELPDQENEAMEVLEDAYKRSGQFRYRLRLGQIKIQQLKRMERSLREQAAKNPQDVEAVKTYREFLVSKAEEEYAEYALAAEAYPTDSTLKFEMARRLIQLQRYPEAIPLLQQSVQDPKLRTDATVELGRAFLEAEFYDEAVDTLKGLTETYQLQDAKAKEIWYWYGRSLEKRGDNPDAIKCYSKVTMWDFNYRDVQVRIKALRAKATQAS